jgi:hypothetical protein
LEKLTKYHSGYDIKKTDMGKTCSTYGEKKSAYEALVGKPERRRPFGRSRCISKDGVTKRIDLTQDKDRWWAVEGMVMNLRVP